MVPLLEVLAALGLEAHQEVHQEGMCFVVVFLHRGNKHDFTFINICKVHREVL